MSYTTFRQQVAAAVADALAIGTLVDGQIDGPIERTPLVCSWPLGVTETDDSADVEQIEVAVRVILAFQQQRDPMTPIDPAPLEQVMATIKDATHQIQTTSGPWFWRPVELAVDVAAQHVTARIVAWQYNLFEQV